MNQTPAKVRRKFDETFKRAALENWHGSGKSATVIAQELGLKANRLYAWQQRFATLAERQTQLAAARREIARISEQRDILKKTLGILSEPAPSVINGLTR